MRRGARSARLAVDVLRVDAHLGYYSNDSHHRSPAAGRDRAGASPGLSRRSGSPASRSAASAGWSTPRNARRAGRHRGPRALPRRAPDRHRHRQRRRPRPMACAAGAAGDVAARTTRTAGVALAAGLRSSPASRPTIRRSSSATAWTTASPSAIACCAAPCPRTRSSTTEGGHDWPRMDAALAQRCCRRLPSAALRRLSRELSPAAAAAACRSIRRSGRRAARRAPACTSRMRARPSSSSLCSATTLPSLSSMRSR